MRNFGRGTWDLPSFGRAEYGGVKLPAWWEAPPKIGGCSRCARPAGTLAAEKNVLAGGAGQNMIALSFPACGRGNSARRALPGESVGRKGQLGPSGLFAGCRPDLLGVPYRASPLDGRGLDTLQGISHPQSLPLGGRTVRGTVRSGPGEATINHRCPSAHTGADEGATLYPTFPCRSRKGGYRLSPRRFFSPAPLGNPVALISHLR